MEFIPLYKKERKKKNDQGHSKNMSHRMYVVEFQIKHIEIIISVYVGCASSNMIALLVIASSKQKMKSRTKETFNPVTIEK